MCNGKCSGAMCVVAWIAKILLIVGGLNWGLVGVSMLMGSMPQWNLVTMLLGSWPMVEAIVYLLVGVSAVVSIFGCRCKTCTGGTCGVDHTSAPTMTQPMQ